MVPNPFITISSSYRLNTGLGGSQLTPLFILRVLRPFIQRPFILNLDKILESRSNHLFLRRLRRVASATDFGSRLDNQLTPFFERRVRWPGIMAEG